MATCPLSLKIPLKKVSAFSSIICFLSVTLKSLLNINKVALSKVAIELNKKIIDKKKIDKIKLKNGDKIEIVHFIGGG